MRLPRLSWLVLVVSSWSFAFEAPVERQLEAARKAAPGVFSGVRTVVTRAESLDAKRRGRFFPMTRLLRDLAREGQGTPGAVLAFLEPLAHPERFPLPVKASARIALRAGLIEAAGDLKDPLAAPTWRQVITAGQEPFEVRAAAEALGKLGLDADVEWLARLATTPGPTQDAVIGGLGSCRRARIAAALKDVAQAQPPHERAVAVASALSHLASAWALAVPDAAPKAELPALRHDAAQGALALYLSADERSLRDAAADALLSIDAPETLSLIAEARASADGVRQPLLDALRQRFEQNATRGAR